MAVDAFAVGEVLAAFFPLEGDTISGAEALGWSVAGAELNALIGMRRLGHSAALVTAVGDDPFGARVRQVMADEGLHGRFDPAASGPTAVFFRELSTTGQRRVFYYRTASAASAVDPEFARRAFQELRPRFLVMSGLTLGLGGPGGLGEAAWACMTEAKATGVQTVFDANLRPGIWAGDWAAQEFARAIDSIDHLLAGEDELAVLVGTPDWRTAARALVDEGVTSVVVKHGPQGSTVFTRGSEVSVAALRADAVDSIGAGDAYLAGYVSGLLRGLGYEAAARRGSLLGARAVGARGDWEALPTLEEVEDFSERV